VWLLSHCHRWSECHPRFEDTKLSANGKVTVAQALRPFLNLCQGMKAGHRRLDTVPEEGVGEAEAEVVVTPEFFASFATVAAGLDTSMDV
jgi:hypothetical protein